MAIEGTGARVETGFRVREEVVVRLNGLEVYSIERGVCVPEGARPDWGIGEIVEIRTCADRRSYVVWFRYRRKCYVAVVPEQAIEGVA
jgi:hypothetical protein